MAKITVELNEDQHERFVRAKMRRKERSLQSLMIGATEKLLAETSDSPAYSREAKPHHGPDLTEDQIDILAILAENPKRGLLFQAVQTTVKHALEEYRDKFKPKRDPKEAPGPIHHKRSAG